METIKWVDIVVIIIYMYTFHTDMQVIYRYIIKTLLHYLFIYLFF